MNYRTVSLAIAEIAGILALYHFVNTPLSRILSMFIPEVSYLFLLAVPVILYMASKQPYSFSYFFILLIVITIPSAVNFELFEGILDSLYFLGLKSTSRAIAEILNYPFPVNTAYFISASYIISIFIEEIQSRKGFGGKYEFVEFLPTIFLTSGLLFIFLKLFTGFEVTEVTPLIALVTAFIIAFAISLMRWGS